MTIPCLKVSEITSCIKELLEQSFVSVCIQGEISNCRPSSTGHLYFTLKDDKAAIAAVMFKGKSHSLTFEPTDGMQVKATGSISVYAQRGTYQIIVESMEQTGTGDILAMLEMRKQKLAAEGIFDTDRKKPLPFFPSRIGVVTSPTGAALRDILQILNRRNSGINVLILPAPVQGTEAAPAIAQRILEANEWDMADVLIVGRGGGSLEDLLPFSEECVVRAIAQSHIPIVSAVGHEIDWALSDFAADMRAPTPSAAAELCSPELDVLQSAVQDDTEILCDSIHQRLQQIRYIMQPFSAETMGMQLQQILQPVTMRYDDAYTMLCSTMQERISTIKRRLELTTAHLEACDPAAVLSRGFSIVRTLQNNRIVRTSEDTPIGTSLQIETKTSRINATVTAATDK